MAVSIARDSACRTLPRASGDSQKKIGPTLNVGASAAWARKTIHGDISRKRACGQAMPQIWHFGSMTPRYTLASGLEPGWNIFWAGLVLAWCSLYVRPPLTILLVIWPSLLFAAYLIVRANRMDTADGEVQAKEDRRAPVLYLRAFRTDERYGVWWWLKLHLMGHVLLERTTQEEAVTGFLRRIGPVIALGRPGESLPPLGATRIYVPNAEWQSRVLRLFTESKVLSSESLPVTALNGRWSRR